MDKAKSINKILNHIENIKANYQGRDEEIAKNYSSKITKLAEEFQKKSERLLDENRKLRIGIVGQIKVGKSSFLNSLLFNSKATLPKAATPMTAALTLISYGEEPKAEVEFYNKNDWDKIESKAQKADRKIEGKRKELVNQRGSHNVPTDQIKNLANLSLEEKTAKELVDMVSERNLNINDYLEQTKEINLEEMSNYVGVNGEYTPLIKSSHLFINDERIKNIEVVDTPGMNDPIISRGTQTREYLGHCDVVFLLSYAGQFLDSSDIGILRQNLPNEGVEEVVIVGSKVDSPLIGIGYDFKGDLERSLINLENNLEEHAKDTITNMLNQEPDNKILKKLNNNLPPKFISAMCYDIAENYNNMNKEQEFIFNKLNKVFDYEFTPELLKDLANIDSIKENELVEIKENKDKILTERFNNFLPGQIEYLKEILEEFKWELEDRIKELENTNLAQLNKREARIKKQIESMEKETDYQFDEMIHQAKLCFKELNYEIQDFIFKNNDLNIKSRSETRRVKKRGVLNGIKRLFKSSSGYRHESYNVKYADIYNVVDSTEELINKLQNKIKQEINRSFDLNEFRNDLEDVIIKTNDISETNFDVKYILRPLERTIEEIKIPEINFNYNKYERMITSQFNTDIVEGDNKIRKLKELQKEVFNNILKDMEKELESEKIHIINSLNNAKEGFLNDLLENSRAEIEEIRKEINSNKEELSIIKKKYNRLISQINEDISKVQKLNEFI